MPTIIGTDLFNHNNFTVPGGGPYSEVNGSPATDLTIVRPGDPASLLLANAVNTAESLGYTNFAPAARAWNGVFCRLNSADATASSFWFFVQMYCSPEAGAAAKWGYSTFANQLYTDVNGVNNFAAFSLDTWHWVETIFDVSGTTHTMYVRIDGVDMTPTSESGSSASHVNSLYLGAFQLVALPGIRLSHHMWGTAASTSDWLGAPASGQVILPDADIATTGWSTAPLYSKINDSSDSTVITATAS